MEITNINQLDLNGTYSYADYLLWKFSERVELLKGKILKMSPAPARKHQKISFNLGGYFYTAFKGKKCEVYTAPFDVRLPSKDKKGNDTETVVQPDLCVICDPAKLDEHGCNGAPDLIIEILSPGNSKREMKQKFQIYEEAGVLEYWIIDPSHESILVNVLENGKYHTLNPVVDDFVPSEKFPDLKIHTNTIFEE